uniref:Uncharacterized protein n=1 Tax=Ditylenchus dipsaci TaxID=166011 RepID=A0A915D8X2_9BILA
MEMYRSLESLAKAFKSLDFGPANLCLFVFLRPPQKYSLHLSRKELINELQGLSRKVGEMRSKWSNEAAQQPPICH